VVEPYGYILKPFDKNELHSTIAIALYKSKKEKELLYQKWWLSTILDNIDDAVLAMGLDGNITFMNPAAEALTGWKEIDARNQPAEVVLRLEKSEIDNSLDPAFRNYFEEEIDQEKTFRLLRTIDNEKIFIEYTHMPILDEKQQTIGYIDTFRDATKRKKMKTIWKKQKK